LQKLQVYFADIFAGSSAEEHGFQPTYAAFGGVKASRFF
jgi:hypothetical protein